MIFVDTSCGQTEVYKIHEIDVFQENQSDIVLERMGRNQEA